MHEVDPSVSMVSLFLTKIFFFASFFVLIYIEIIIQIMSPSGILATIIPIKISRVCKKEYIVKKVDTNKTKLPRIKEIIVIIKTSRLI